MDGHSSRRQWRLQLAQRLLPGAQNDRVALDQLPIPALLPVADDDSLGRDPFVIDTADHLDVLHQQRGAVDPARGLAESLPELARLALKQSHLARRWRW